MRRKIKGKLVAIAATSCILAANAHASSDPIAEGLTTIEGYWDTVKVFVAGVVIFMVGLGFVRKMKKS